MLLYYNNLRIIYDMVFFRYKTKAADHGFCFSIFYGSAVRSDREFITDTAYIFYQFGILS